jgi:hypothetical protein
LPLNGRVEEEEERKGNDRKIEREEGWKMHLL